MTLNASFNFVNQWIPIISDWTGAISFAASAAALFFSLLWKEKRKQHQEYEEMQNKILQRLNTLRKDVIARENFTKTTVSDIRTEIYKAQHHFNRLLGGRDKKRLQTAHELLSFDTESIDKNALCDIFDYFIAKISKEQPKPAPPNRRGGFSR